MVLDDGEEEFEDEESKFAASASIQALVALTDPVGHASVKEREEAAQRRWTYSKTYFFYAAEFYGKNVSSEVDTGAVIARNPRSFSVKIFDPGNVRK